MPCFAPPSTLAHRLRAAARRMAATMGAVVAVAVTSALALAALPAAAADEPGVIEIRTASAVASSAAVFPQDLKQRSVRLPDDWAESLPQADGPVWYRLEFTLPAPHITPAPLMAAYIERACSTAQVWLNGNLVFSGGHMTEPVTRGCFYPQLVTLPPALLNPQGNVLDIKVQGSALQHVASRQRAGGLSAVQIGPHALLAELQARQTFWNVSLVQVISAMLVPLGIVMLGMGWQDRRSPYLIYFGLLAIGWAALSARLWWRDPPWDNATSEFGVCVGFGVLVALAIQFLMRYAAMRSTKLEIGLLVQCVLVPVSLALAGPERLYTATSGWYLLLSAEVMAAVTLYLRVTWRKGPDGRAEFWPMAFMLMGVGVLVLVDLATQHGWITLLPVHVLHFSMPLMFIAVGARQIQIFGRALQVAEASRNSLESRINEVTAEIERNFSQMAELRVEQVTEKERKRIAADLHDDLGAKLLTIVHTSESERISTLAREALEEMRLSVRGLTGKPMQVADALADWRAETVSRLSQANIEADWRSPTEDVHQQLSARAFVQTTRILREAVSNIIKHSGASHCKVRCSIGEHDFVLVVQDNGKGIPMELDGKLDRGHGMASMKHRAKQMQGQCLVESGPGYGTVIRLTLPL
jgi:two-component system sensor histidine kinase UhpB